MEFTEVLRLSDYPPLRKVVGLGRLSASLACLRLSRALSPMPAHWLGPKAAAPELGPAEHRVRRDCAQLQKRRDGHLDLRPLEHPLPLFKATSHRLSGQSFLGPTLLRASLRALRAQELQQLLSFRTLQTSLSRSALARFFFPAPPYVMGLSRKSVCSRIGFSYLFTRPLSSMCLLAGGLVAIEAPEPLLPVLALGRQELPVQLLVVERSLEGARRSC